MLLLLSLLACRCCVGIKGINTKLTKYLLIMKRCSCKTRGITLKAIFMELCPFKLIFLMNDGPRQTSVGTAFGALVFYLLW